MLILRFKNSYFFLLLIIIDGKINIKPPTNHLINKNMIKYEFLDIIHILCTYLPNFEYKFTYQFKDNKNSFLSQIKVFFNTFYKIPKIHNYSQYIDKKYSLNIVNNYNKYILCKKLIDIHNISIDYRRKYINILKKNIKFIGVNEILKNKLKIENEILSLMNLEEKISLINADNKYGINGNIENFSTNYLVPFGEFKFKKYFIPYSFSINKQYLEFSQWIDNVNFFWQYTNIINNYDQYSFYINNKFEMFRDYNKLQKKIKKKKNKIFYNITKTNNLLLRKKLLINKFYLFKEYKNKLQNKNCFIVHHEYNIVFKIIKIIENIHNIDYKISRNLWEIYLELIPLEKNKNQYLYGTNFSLTKK
ncbi:hypothetical protein AB836_00945 [Rickettsiales bacterium (ex Bugula neritina AB1)]|nr:hypothetical protein AB836_00945 [Rickettsiales bacterium (ex Bugula neritina AB1)]